MIGWNASRRSAGRLSSEADLLEDGRTVEVDDVGRHVLPGRLVPESGPDQAAVEAVGLGIEAADDAEVHDADPSVAQQEHVAGVHVAVEEPVAEHRQEPRSHHLIDERPWIEAQPGGGLEIVDRCAVEVLHGEHAGAGELREGLGNGDEVQALRLDQRAEVAHRPHLVAEIELLGDLFPKARQDAGELAGGGEAHPPGEEIENRAHEPEVGREYSLDPGPQHLDRHGAAVVQGGPVHDRERRATDRARVERREDALERAAELVLHHPPHVVERDRGSGVETRAEDVRHGLAEDARGRSDELPELDVRRAEILERSSDRSRERQPRQRSQEHPPARERGEVARRDAQHLGGTA
jgi:hypothetical protein